jgi:hypothetical protein
VTIRTRLEMRAVLAWSDLRICLAKLWLRFPGRVTALLALATVAVGGFALFSSIGLAMRGHPVWGASIMIAVLSLFIFLIEPWLACTGNSTTGRPRHAPRVRRHADIQSHRNYLHQIASQVEPGLRIDILSGLCPWLLAYWVEDLLNPQSQASLQALRLDLHTHSLGRPAVRRPRL